MFPGDSAMRRYLFVVLSLVLVAPQAYANGGTGRLAREADFDGSGQVDFQDFLTFVRAWGTRRAEMDLSGNGWVDFADFLIFSRLFSQPVLRGTVQLADPNLEAAVREALRQPEGELLADDVGRLTVLAATGRGITQLDGITQLPALVELDLEGNRISDLLPLAGLTSLKRLRLGDNQIRDIGPLSNLTMLMELQLAINQISDISALGNLTMLTELWLDRNLINDVAALSNLTALYGLDIGANRISDIGPLVDSGTFQKGGFIGVGANPLSEEALQVQIPALEARGVLVEK